MKKLFITTALAMIFCVSPSYAEQSKGKEPKPLVEKTQDFDDKFEQAVVREFCALPKPQACNSLYYTWEKGRCVAKVKTCK